MYKHIPDVGFLQQLLRELAAKTRILQSDDELRSNTLDHFLCDNAQKLQDLQKAISSKVPIKCCLNDGQPLTDQSRVFRCPNRQKRHGEYGFYDYAFCSLSCVKTYLETRNNFSPHLIVWLTIYAKRVLGVLDDIPSAPAPELLAMYRTDEGGVSLTTYRQFEKSHKLTEKIKHCALNRALWEDEEQKDAEQPFFELIRSTQRVEQQLYQEYVRTGKPIPKAAIPDANSIEAARQDDEQSRVQALIDHVDHLANKQATQDTPSQ